MIYLDHAATSMHKPPQVYEAVLSAMQTCASVGRSGHQAARLAADIVYECRSKAAAMFDAAPSQVVFTSNATHGLNVAINSLVSRGDRVVISGFEHNAVIRPLHHIGAEIIVAGTRLFDPADTLLSFERAIDDNTTAVICTHVSNVFGYILPVYEIAELCRKKRIPFILDASQSAGVLPVSMGKTGASFIAMPGHKGLLGPQGTGILLCGVVPKPLICGGTGSNSLDMDMPDFLPDAAEAGTHNTPGNAGLSAALSYLQQVGLDEIFRKEHELNRHLYEELKRMGNLRVYYGNGRHQTGVLSFQIPGIDCEIAAGKLAEADIAVRAGLHCAWLAHKSAGTLKNGTIRVSFSSENSHDDVEKFVRTLGEIIL